MNKAFELILERLEKERIILLENNLHQAIALNFAKGIVQEVAEEYSGGWIPCSERLPEEGVDVLVWFEYFRYGSFGRPYKTIGISYTYKGDWSGFFNGSSGWRDLRIIAWQPLPEPYQQKGEREVCIKQRMQEKCLCFTQN